MIYNLFFHSVKFSPSFELFEHYFKSMSLTQHIIRLILVIDQLNAQILFFIISLLYASTCFEHYVLIIRRSKLYYTASGIITLCRCYDTRCCIIQGGSNMTGTDLCVNKPHCAAAVQCLSIMVTKKKSVPVIFEPSCTILTSWWLAHSARNM